MKPWRIHEDPWEEARRLEVAPICKRMNWGRRRLTAELERSGSEEFFIARVLRCRDDLDAPRLLHRDPAQPPTHSPALAAKGEPEMVSEDYEGSGEGQGTGLVLENRTKDAERRMEINTDRKKRPLDRRLVLCMAESRNRGIAIGSQLGAIERQIERIEKRLDRIA